MLRIAAREKGIRVYEAAPEISLTELKSAPDRLQELVLLLANIFAPSPRKSLQETVNKLRYSFSHADGLRTVLDVLIKAGKLSTETIDGVPYVFPAAFKTRKEVSQEVKILAPFDPVVWDRRRFEHLWDWSYRFEAYTPKAKRLRGYYAMPVLWGDNVIGWVNISATAKGLSADVGYATKRPKELAFRNQLKQEIERVEAFLVRR